MGNIDQICAQVEPNSQYQNQRQKIINIQKNKGSQIKIGQEGGNSNQQIHNLPLKSQTPRIKSSPFLCGDQQQNKTMVRDALGMGTLTKSKTKYNQTNQDKSQTNLTKKSSYLSEIMKFSIKRGGKQFFYQGQTVNNQMHGYGKIIDEVTRKIIYEGQFKNNCFDGWGFNQFYQGEFKLNKYQGYGIYKDFIILKPDIITTFYQGYFRNGDFQGKGVLFKNCKLPVSQLEEIHKLGVFEYIYSQIQHNMKILKKFQIEEIYIGQFSNGLKHGYGRLFKQNYQFSGQFSHDIYHGLGTSYFNGRNGQQQAIQAIYKMGKQYRN